MKLTKENFEKYIKNPEVKKYHSPQYILPSNLIKKEVQSGGGFTQVIK